MKKNITDVIYECSSENMKEFLTHVGEITFVCKLDKILRDRGLSQKDFAEITGLRPSTISHFINIKKYNINIGHLILIMTTLQITDISEIIEVEFDNNLQDEMALNKARWENTGEMPESIQRLLPNKLERDE